MVIVKLMGGLGNQMFQYAMGRRLAEKHKTVLKLDTTFLLDRTFRKNFTFRNFDLQIFNIQENIASIQEIKSHYNILKRGISKLYPNCNLNSYVKEKKNDFDSTIINLGDNFYLDGYWASEKYFKDIEPIIREEFSFKNSISSKITETIASTDSICIHIRRGDYISNPVINKKMGVMDMGYYKKGLAYICERIENPNIFVFSDDMNWVKTNLKFDFPTTYVDFNNAGTNEDMRLMSLCKHNIIANSTFSWWGAWLNNNEKKIVVAPEKWFNDGNSLSGDLIPSQWNKM